MNPTLDRLQSYPFERLRALLDGAAPPPGLRPIALHIGEPKHPTPDFIKRALIEHLDGLAGYPLTVGTEALRHAIAAWLERRYGLASIDANTQVIPVNGTREALFAFAQAVIDATRAQPTVVCPNPFYQIYEGAALLANATPQFLNSVPARHYAFDLAEISETTWRHTQLLYVCSPDNPTGRVMPLAEWRALFELSDRYGFVIASDECYSEIHFDEAKPPLGALAAAQALGRTGYPRLAVFGSLSKRSNAPGLRSGYVAGDAALVKAFLQYRTYHGSAMSGAVAAASLAAWSDEAHVVQNRAEYAAKFARLAPLLATALPCDMPDAAFYLWPQTPGDDQAFARRLLAEENVTVLPGSYLAREAHGVNPGAGRVRIALVPDLAHCAEAIERIIACARRS